ncbi:GGDEF domain-containing protein [Allorhizobium terrae]|uniref:diguanylate cyclase n=2 Tax=Allorhizobium terrae TaxID=1848972 RepID=A0A4S3ZTC0_9HYPH|nr:GGDEF domain-containing protein [Allorhizobium terrae]
MQNITVEDVDRQVRRGFLLMRFSPKIESAYLVDYAANRMKLVLGWAVVGTIVYNLMLFGDAALAGDVFKQLLFVRVCVFTPLVVVGLYFLHRHPTALSYDLLAIGVAVFSTLLPMTTVIFSRSHDLYAYQNANTAAFLFFIIVLRPRFFIGVIGLILLSAIHLITMKLTGAFDSGVYLSIASLVLSTAVFLGAGAYYLEHTDRMNFLHRLKSSLLHQQLILKSEQDGLTGLLNRHSLSRISDDLWSSDTPSTICAILLDIDHFKAFNDIHGHIHGDECLRKVSQSIAKMIGNDGHVFRFGGEEILVLIDDADEAAGLEIAEIIRAAIEALCIPHSGLGQGKVVTASLGVATVTLPGNTFEDLLKKADTALYNAKRSGRNRAFKADDLVTA